MNKQKQIISVIVAAVLVALIPVISNTLNAASPIYGTLDQFNVYIKNDYTIESSTVEGRVIVGNDLSASGENNVATAYDSSISYGDPLEDNGDPSVIVKGNVNIVDTLTVSQGKVILSVLNELLDLNLGTELTIDNDQNITEGFEYFEGRETDLLATLMNLEIDETDPATGQTLDGYYASKDKSLMIFDLDGTTIASSDERYTATEETEEETAISGTNRELRFTSVSFDTLQEHEKIIIRSNAEYIDFDAANVFYEDEELAITMLEDLSEEEYACISDRIVWVFPNAKEVEVISGATIGGTMIAPNATVTMTNSSFVGQLYANNLNQKNSTIINKGSFVNDYDFNRSIDTSTITVNFVDTEGEILHDPLVFTREVGTFFQTQLPIIDGYDILSTSEYDALTFGFVVPEADQEMILEYEALYTATLTVYHQLVDGTDIVEPIKTYGNIGDEYITEALNDADYVLTVQPTNTSGVLEATTEVTYVYAPASTVKTLTVRHVDTSGQDLVASTVLNLDEGSSYDVSDYVISSNIYEYTGLYTGSAPINGVISENTTVMFTYESVTTCAQFGTSTSGETADTKLNISSANRVKTAEMEYNNVSSRLIQELAVTENDTTKYNFGSVYRTEESGTTFTDFRYSFNGNQTYTQFMPIRQEGDFEPINILVSNEGNSYDIRSRTSASSLFDYDGNGLNYQSTLGAIGEESLLVRFEECQMVVSYNGGTSANNGTVIETFAYTDFMFLGEDLAGYMFNWDPSTKKLVVDIVFEKNKELYYSGNSFAIDLTNYVANFLPTDYAIIANNTSTSSTKIYEPYTISARHLYEVVALKSPYIDASTRKLSLSDALANNQIYEIYAVNGKVSYRKQLTSASVVKKYSLPYNPKSYLTMPSNGFTNKSTEGIYSYIAGNSYTPITGLTLKAESQVIYGRNQHSTYSLNTTGNSVVFGTDLYTSILQSPNFEYDATIILNGESTTESELLDHLQYFVVDESGVTFETTGDYTALGYVRTRDETTGEYITSSILTTVTVTGAVMDYGDAPESYGSAGALIGDSSNRFNIGINRNGNRATHADAESEPQYSEDARGDDITGITDETGWFNMDTNGIGELNVVMDKMTITFPYTASINNKSKAAFWIDYNQNGVFESSEGKLSSNLAIADYNGNGMVSFTIDLSDYDIEAGDTTYARVRIVNDTKLSLGDAAKDFDAYGETEDFLVHFYGGEENEYQICNLSLANTPIVTIHNQKRITDGGPDKNEVGVEYTLDIGEWNPNSGSKNSFYPDAKLRVSSSAGIVSTGRTDGQGDPIYFTSLNPDDITPDTIHIETFNKAGDPINLPLTFTIWGLDKYTSENVVEYVVLDKSKMYTEGLYASDIKTTYDSVGEVEPYDTYFKLFATEERNTEPSSMFFIQSDSLAKSSVEIQEAARDFEIGIGLDLGQMDKLITECIEPYEPLAQIEVMGEFYGYKVTYEDLDLNGDGVTDITQRVIETDPVDLYTNYPFKYQSTNIPIPYFSNFNSVKQVLKIPDGIQFVDQDGSGEIEDNEMDVTIYRRDFLGSRTESDWQLVDESLYTQVLDKETNITTVEFLNPVENNVYGYEYRMEYNFEISEEMETGQQVVFESEVVFNKGENGEHTETYYLNDVVVNVLESFASDINTIMGDETIYVDIDSDAIYYTYEYINCETCASSGIDENGDLILNEEGKPINNLSGNIEIPIPDESDMNFYSDSNFDRYEDIVLRLYDNNMKVFEVPIRRWYPANMDFEISDTSELTEFTDNLNPVGQTAQIRASYTQYPGFEKPLVVSYSQEVLSILKEDVTSSKVDLLSLEGLSAAISTSPQDSVPSSWQAFADGSFIEVDDLVDVFDKQLVYIPDEGELCSSTNTSEDCVKKDYHLINVEPEALDSTLETSESVIKGNKYKDIYYDNNYSIGEDGSIKLNSMLSDRYVIEDYSGRLYNTQIATECSLSSAVDEGYEGKYCYGDKINNYNIASYDATNVIAGYNDATDNDTQVNTIVNGLPLSTEAEVGDKFKYYIYLAQFGLNNSNISIADEKEITTNSVGYFANDSQYYFKRVTPTDDETKCIKDGDCDDQYQVIVSGTIGNTEEVKNKVESDLTLLENYKILSEWITGYRQSII